MAESPKAKHAFPASLLGVKGGQALSKTAVGACNGLEPSIGHTLLSWGCVGKGHPEKGVLWAEWEWIGWRSDVDERGLVGGGDRARSESGTGHGARRTRQSQEPGVHTFTGHTRRCRTALRLKELHRFSLSPLGLVLHISKQGMQTSSRRN